MWQSPLSTAIAASQGQASNSLLQQITMLHNFHHQQLPSLNYLQVAVAPTSTTNHVVVKQEPSGLRIPSGFTSHSSSNGSSSHAHMSASYSLTSKLASVSAPSTVVPSTNAATTSCTASKRPCFSDSEESTQTEIQAKRNSPRRDASPRCINSRPAVEFFDRNVGAMHIKDEVVSVDQSLRDAPRIRLHQA